MQVRARIVASLIADLAHFGVAPVRRLAPCSRIRIPIGFLPLSLRSFASPKASQLGGAPWPSSWLSVATAGEFLILPLRKDVPHIRVSYVLSQFAVDARPGRHWAGLPRRAQGMGCEGLEEEQLGCGMGARGGHGGYVDVPGEVS